MIIGIDARPLSYYFAGIGHYLLNILDVLQRLDQENTYYLVSNKKINYRPENPRWHKIEGRAGRKLLSSLWMQVFVPGFARRYRFDIFWGPRHHLPLLMSKRVKRVVTVHDLVHLRYPETMKPANLILERILMKRSLETADAVIAVSQASALDVTGFYRKVDPKRIHTIYSGVPQWPEGQDDADFIRTLPPYYFLFVGTMEPRKNIAGIISAFERLPPEAYDGYLIIVGETGWKINELKACLRNPKLGDRIILKGYIPRRHLKGLYQNAACLVFPSFYEGFGFPILEAMAFGTPVITSNTASMKEIAGDAALLVDPYRVEDIAGAMRRIIGDAELRSRLNREAASRLPLFSWQKCAEALMEICYRVCSY